MIVFREFPGCTVVRLQHFHYQDLGSVPSWGIKIPQATQHGQGNKTHTHTHTHNVILFPHNVTELVWVVLQKTKEPGKKRYHVNIN